MAPFIQAFSHAVGGLLSLPLPARTAWRERIESVLDESGKLVTDLVPELDRLVGPQAPSRARDRPRPKTGSPAVVGVRSRARRGRSAGVVPGRPAVGGREHAEVPAASFHRGAAQPPVARGRVSKRRAGSATEQALATCGEAGTAVTSLAVSPLDLDAVTALLVETLRSNPPDGARSRAPSTTRPAAIRCSSADCCASCGRRSCSRTTDTRKLHLEPCADRRMPVTETWPTCW